MRLLIIGNGGREHALAVALARSPVSQIVYATRPNPGMRECCTALDISPTDVDAIENAAKELNIDLVVVGPEAPLVAGVSDRLRAAGIPVFGPSKAAARIEGSKAFAKEIMAAARVPTAEYGTFTNANDAVGEKVPKESNCETIESGCFD